jgi:hypothetical protein
MVVRNIQLNVTGYPTATETCSSIPIPEIDVAMLFPTNQQLTCTKIKDILRQSGSLESFLRQYNLKDQALYNNIFTFNKNLSNSSIDQRQAVSDISGYTEIKTYLEKVKTNQLPVLRLVNDCLAESTTVNPASLVKAESDYEASKARYESVTSDIERVSYYEGWFPLFHPMKERSLFIMFGLSIILLIISVLFFLQVGGVHIKFILPETTVPYPTLPTPSYTKYIYSGVGCGILYILVGRYFNWF